MDVVEAPAERYPELIDLLMRRCPLHERHLVAAPLEDPTYATDRHFVMAVDGDTLLGWGQRLHSRGFPDDWRSLRIVVAGEHEGQGIGRELHAVLTEGVAPEISLRSGVLDDDPRSLAIARHWRFEPLLHSITSHLDLPPTVPDRPLPPDVAVEHSTTLEFADQAAFDEMLTRSQTNPEAALFLMDRGVLLGFLAEGEEPLGVLLRVDGLPAAICWAAAFDGKVHIDYTGVDPRFRGRGLGYLVKQAAHRIAHEQGAATCITDNEERNLGIRHVNEALGYRKVSGIYRMHRPLES